MIAIALITINVVAILLAIQTPLVATDAGRLFLVAAVTAMVVCSPLADGMPIIDRLIAATIGGLLGARSTAYTMRLNVARVAVTA